MGELGRRWATGPSGTAGGHAPRDLTPYELRVFSQNGEDGVIAEILRRTGVGTQRFVEFGAEDGREGNCLFLAEVLGWGGVFIEGDSGAFATLERRFRDRPAVHTVHAMVSPGAINGLISGCGVAGDIDVLSIDIDSHDYWVWEAIDVVSPRLVVIEYNAHIPYPERRTQPLSESGPWQGTDYFGASLGALEHLASRLGYRLVHTDLAGVNAFFVRNDLAGDFPRPGDVPKRAPNFFLTGQGHPADATGRPWVDPAA